MRRFLMGAYALLLGGLGLYLDSILESRWWVETRVGQPQLSWEGWEGALHAWPLVLVGVLVGGALSLTALIWIYKRADEADHNREIERVERDGARNVEILEREYKERLDVAERMIEESNADIQKAKRHELALKEREANLDATLAAAQNEREWQFERREAQFVTELASAHEAQAEAEQRARNTRHAYDRKVRHCTDLQARLDGTEHA